MLFAFLGLELDSYFNIPVLFSRRLFHYLHMYSRYIRITFVVPSGFVPVVIVVLVLSEWCICVPSVSLSTGCPASLLMVVHRSLVCVLLQLQLSKIIKCCFEFVSLEARKARNYLASNTTNFIKNVGTSTGKADLIFVFNRARV